MVMNCTKQERDHLHWRPDVTGHAVRNLDATGPDLYIQLETDPVRIDKSSAEINANSTDWSAFGKRNASCFSTAA